MRGISYVYDAQKFHRYSKASSVDKLFGDICSVCVLRLMFRFVLIYVIVKSDALF